MYINVTISKFIYFQVKYLLIIIKLTFNQKLSHKKKDKLKNNFKMNKIQISNRCISFYYPNFSEKNEKKKFIDHQSAVIYA